MPVFGKTSLARLAQLDTDLHEVLTEAIKHIDFAIICGHRSEEEQDAAYEAGKSQLKYPHSKHNSLPSRAVDIAPMKDGKVSWDTHDCAHLSGFVLGVAAMMGKTLRAGCDWDMDGIVSDERFKDFPHIEVPD